MNHYTMVGTVALITALPLIGQRTEISRFSSRGEFASGNIFSFSGPTSVSGFVEVSRGCFAGTPSSQTHLFYFISSFGPTGSFSSFGEGCIPDAAFTADAPRNKLTLNVDTAQLDPAIFFQTSSGPPQSTIVSASWEQTDTQTFFNSGVFRETLKLPETLFSPAQIFKHQEQGSNETHSANFAVNLLGITFSQPDGGRMAFNRVVAVEITRTPKP